MVLGERPHKVGGFALLRGIGSKSTILPLDQSAAIGADPQAAIMARQQAKDAVLSKGRRILMGKETETGPVKAQQPAAGANPKITVRGLGEGLDRFLRQAILGLPGAECVVPLLDARRG